MERSAFIKTVISRDKPVELETIYVPLTLQNSELSGMPDSTIDPCAKIGVRAILSGTGGAGKNIVMKHLLNNSVGNKHGLIPLFIELRNLQFDTFTSLQECILADFKQSGEQETGELFQVALEEGLLRGEDVFAIFLDGYDEIHPEEHEKALRYIRRFSDQFPKISILISTRPKTAAETLRDYSIYHLEPLDKQKAIELVEKTDFEEVTKSKFLASLKDGLYEKHQTLMSLPILVGMMLLAYRTYADIPDRMTVFYSQAFETLYSIHDAENKELFKRQHHAGLAPDVFKSVLQAFCYLSLSNHDIEFTEATLNSYVGRALAIAKVDVSPDKYKNDLIHNVCVLQPDGLSYVFVHRSFQEYFAALFAINYSGSQHFEIFDQIIDVSGSAVARMMIEIDAIKTRRYWLLPKVRLFTKHLTTISRRKAYNQIPAFCQVIWVEECAEGNVASYSLGTEGDYSFRVMSLINECSTFSLGFGDLVNNLDLPSEEILINAGVPAKEEVVTLKSRRTAGFSYGHQRTYPFSAIPNTIMNNVGFT